MKRSERANSYNNFLAQKHAKLNTPLLVIEEVVNEILGAKVRNLEKIIAGEVNEVYRVTLDRGDEIIIRISRSLDHRFDSEQWAINHCLEIGVPAPVILGITSRLVKQEKITLCLMKKLPGSPMGWILDELRKDNKLLQSLVSQGGEIIEKIHSIKTRGFGWLNADGSGPFKTWEECILSKTINQDNFLESVSRVGLDTALVIKAIERLKDYRELLQNVTPRLLHQDVSPKPLMVEKDKVIGIIDFGNVFSGDPIMDFAWWDYWFTPDLPLEWLMAGYSHKAMFDQNYLLKLNLYKLYLSLGNLDWYIIEDNPSGISSVVERLERDLSRI